MMYLLDTDHLSVLERGGVQAERLRQRLATVAPDQVAVTIVSYEEQTRGWLSYMAKARSVPEQVTVYQQLQRHLQTFCTIPLIGFDDAAAQLVQHLQKSRIRMGTMDMKIAAIALVQQAILLTRNVSDFRDVPNLQVEDWTA